MAVEMEKSVGGVASPSEISEWVESLSKNELHERMQYVESIERQSATLTPSRTDPPPPPNSVRGMPSGTHPVNANGAKGGGGGQDFDLDMVEFHKEISTNNGTTNNGVFLGETESADAPQGLSRVWLLAAAMIFLAVAGAGLLAFGLYQSSKTTNAVEPMPTMTVPMPSAVAPVVTWGGGTPAAAPSGGAAASAAASSASSLPSPRPSASTSPASSVALEIDEPTGPASASASATTAPVASGASSTAPATAPSGAPSTTSAPPKPIGPTWVAPRPTATGKGKACDPPYTIDAQGKRHPKAECTIDF
jgi:serine/threonine-protein kinase